ALGLLDQAAVIEVAGTEQAFSDSDHDPSPDRTRTTAPAQRNATQRIYPRSKTASQSSVRFAPAENLGEKVASAAGGDICQRMVAAFLLSYVNDRATLTSVNIRSQDIHDCLFSDVMDGFAPQGSVGCGSGRDLIGEVAAGSRSASRQECAVCSEARQPPSRDGIYWLHCGLTVGSAGSCRTCRDLAAFLGSPG